MSSQLRRYLAYGLRIDSEVPLPFAPAAMPDADAPEVTVRIGRTPAALTGPDAANGRAWHAKPGALLVSLGNRGRYLAIGGREIRVQPGTGSRRELGQYLVGAPMGALLQQRGIVTLHAAAVATDAGAVLFAGRAGLGKSSLAGALVQRGYAMLSDGFAGVAWQPATASAGGREFMALPGLPGLRLRPDVVAELNCWPQVQGRVYADADKYLLPTARFQSTPVGVRAVYVLTAHDQAETAIERLAAGDGFRALCRHTYRRRFLNPLGQRLAYFRAISAMAGKVPVHRLRRPARPFRLHALAARIDDELRQPASLPVVAAAAGA